MFKHVQLSPYCTGSYPTLDVFKLGAHCTRTLLPPQYKTCYYEVLTVCKRAIGIRLKCLLLVTIRNEVAKVMFLQACVCPRGGCLPQCMLGYHTPPPGSRHPPWEQTPPPRSGHPPGTDTPQSGHPREQTPPQEQTPPWEQTPFLRSIHPPPEIRSLLRTVRILPECILVISFQFLIGTIEYWSAIRRK